MGHDACLAIANSPVVNGNRYQPTVYRALRCAGCGRGGMVTYAAHGSGMALIEFYPRASQLHALKAYQEPRDKKVRLTDVKEMFEQMRLHLARRAAASAS
jgi:predicted nuclease with RNAse H fold